ncbi:MAG: peptidoglycan-associated lipoprotein Pal [Comamonas sp.]
MLSFKKASLALVAAAILAGCSSAPSLDNAPVEDKGAVSTNNGAGAGQTGQSTVGGVDLNNSGANGQGPVGVARIIYFDFDSYTVKPDFQSTLDAHARFLKANPSRRVALEGHTDERGGREYNLALGQKRAEAVRRSLNVLGVSDSQVEAVSFGKEKPAAQGGSEDAHAQNRRVEVNYR